MKIFLVIPILFLAETSALAASYTLGPNKTIVVELNQGEVTVSSGSGTIVLSPGSKLKTDASGVPTLQQGTAKVKMSSPGKPATFNFQGGSMVAELASAIVTANSELQKAAILELEGQSQVRLASLKAAQAQAQAQSQAMTQELAQLELQAG